MVAAHSLCLYFEGRTPSRLFTPIYHWICPHSHMTFSHSLTLLVCIFVASFSIFVGDFTHRPSPICPYLRCLLPLIEAEFIARLYAHLSLDLLAFCADCDNVLPSFLPSTLHPPGGLYKHTVHKCALLFTHRNDIPILRL